MKKIILLAFTLIVIIFNISYSQFTSDPQRNISLQHNKLSKLDLGVTDGRVSLGFNAGIAVMNDNTGLAVGMFAEVKAESFSFVPQANYWKVNKANNFEIAGLMRLRFESVGIEPYVDGGIGINFYNDDAIDINGNEINDNVTKLGLDVGGGLELKNFSTSYTILLDVKYKIIINDPGNIKGFVVTGGLKFPL
ncbi:MAG: hypothetical protein ISS16_01600 [Ignavibacteria bacterium]|nr:hypothetical protein [Ignavibacteria bacterium]